MKILHTADEVSARIEEMARELIARYPDEKPVFVCLLKGAVPFTSQLMTAITRHDPTFHPEVVYAHISSYGTGRAAGRAMTHSGVSPEDVARRAVIVLDDCLDQGITYTEAKRQLLEAGATSVGLVVLVDKAVTRNDVDAPLITGFATPDVWLVGMGMDDAATAPEAERWAGYIGDVSV